VCVQFLANRFWQAISRGMEQQSLHQGQGKLIEKTVATSSIIHVIHSV